MPSESDIAIVGMAARFPGARDLEEFWRNLTAGVESIARLSDAEIAAAGVPVGMSSRPDYVKAAPVLEDPGLFDADYFGYSPSEAAALDPQHRLLLELAQEALDEAGCDPARYPGRIGVFAGSAMNTYFVDRELGQRFAEDYIPTLVGNDKDFLATRISYKLGLRGPSLTVQTACSTSLVAIHLARQSLLSEETDAVLAGAVSIRVPHRAGYFYDGSGVVSPDGHVRAFDAAANGTVFGSGAGMVVLKRLADAVAEGDHIHAVIRGSAANNDGATKAGYTAPSVQGQADVVVEALANAGVSAEEISYLEAHGSGTPVGDRIEILALSRAFRQFTARNGFCAIGSVKTNVGHLDAAAGMAGLIKTVLSLRHRSLPASLNFSRPNQEIDFPATPFVVNAEARSWPAGDGPRRAAVMATGMGGTNACVVLEEAPATSPRPGPAGPHLLVVSARTPAALDAASLRLAQTLASDRARDWPLAAVARTLQTGRRFHSHRRFAVCERAEEAAAALGPGSAAAVTGVAAGEPPAAVYLLPGVGDHYPGMSRGLYERFEVFRREIDRCAEILLPLAGFDIRRVLYPAGAERKAAAKPGIDLKRMLGRTGGAEADPAAAELDRTIHCQPALFAVEYALARLWMHWGVRPARLVGHSMGEYVAACLAGVFSLEDALGLIAARARLVEPLPQGAMVAVLLPERDVLPLLGGGLSIALINGPNLCVVAGPAAEMTEWQERLKSEKIIFRPVRNGHAFHSRMLDPIAGPFAAEVGRIRLNPPRLPLISNLTGTWMTAEQATDPLYWARQTCRTARFGDALGALWASAPDLLLEIGPGRTLTVLAMQHPARPAALRPPALASLPHGYETQPESALILKSAGQAWLGGAEIDWEHFEGGDPAGKLPLPSYPFERRRHWIELARGLPAAGPAQGARKPDLADWFYVPSWKRTPFPAGRPVREDALWLILGDAGAMAERLLAGLRGAGASAVFVCFGDAYAYRGEDSSEIRPGCPEDYAKLLAALKIGGREALNVIHLGGLKADGPDRAQEAGFYSLLGLAQAIGEQNFERPARIGVVTRELQDVTGEERIDPAMATAVGLCGVIPKEYPNVTSFSVDLPGGSAAEPWSPRILSEFLSPVAAAVIAYRGDYRWEKCFQPLRLPAPARGDELAGTGLRARGVYLITGGTGGIGLAVARHLARTCRARLVLTGRSPFPPKSEWSSRLSSPDATGEEKRILPVLAEIEALGGEVDVVSCDVADRAGMASVIDRTIDRHGAFNGVFHAAGILREGVIQLKNRAAAESVFEPKVKGTWVIYDLVKDLELDFLVLFSSLAAIAPNHGLAEYSAANAFLDAFASFASREGRIRTVAIDWPGWAEVGILTRLKALAGLEAQRDALLERAIPTRDGIEALQRALAARAPQLVVCPQDISLCLAGSNAPLPPPVLAAPQAGGRREAGDPPRDTVESAVAAIWSEVLGIAPVGIHQKFLDLGGHSLLAMQIVARVRSAYRVNFTLKLFFEHPTVAGIARTVEEEIVAEIEGMSEDEASRRMSEPPPP